MGGNSTKATSGINGAGTQSQQDLGIQDSARIFFEDTKKSVGLDFTHIVFVAKSLHRLVNLLATTLSPS
jgi:succinate dehydrogenase/fumarate reductase flavoprotein subunit